MLFLRLIIAGLGVWLGYTSIVKVACTGFGRLTPQCISSSALPPEWTIPASLLLITVAVVMK
jgi:hypothetical protein